MATEKNKWIDAMAKLLQLTQDDKLKWTPRTPPSYLNSLPDSQYVEVVYETQHKDWKLRVYEVRSKVEKPNNPLASIGVSSIFDQIKYPYWTTRTVLELLDQTGHGAWTFPSTEVSGDLIAAVRYQAAGVKEFLDEILAVAS